MPNDEDRFENLTEAANHYLTKIGRLSCKRPRSGSVYGLCPKCGTEMTAPPRRWGMSCTKYCPNCKHSDM